jgi:hypothetical protein
LPFVIFEKGANNIAPNIAIKFPESELIKVENHLTFNFRFKQDLLLQKGIGRKQYRLKDKKELGIHCG